MSGLGGALLLDTAAVHFRLVKPLNDISKARLRELCLLRCRGLGQLLCCSALLSSFALNLRNGRAGLSLSFPHIALLTAAYHYFKHAQLRVKLL